MKKFFRGVPKRVYTLIILVAALIGIGVPARQFWPWRAPVIVFTNPVPGTVTAVPRS